MVQLSGLYEHHSNGLCRGVPRIEPFVKIPYLSLVLEAELLHSFPKNQHHRRGSEQKSVTWQLCGI